MTNFLKVYINEAHVYCDIVEVHMMDRPSATEMDRGGAYEMDRQTKCHKIAKATEMVII